MITWPSKGISSHAYQPVPSKETSSRWWWWWFVFCSFCSLNLATRRRLRWGVVTATDIPIAWMVARVVFGDGHPAIDYLLLLAVADDALGLVSGQTATF